MGDRFTTSSATGTSTLSIPVPTSRGQGSLGADITLNYNSGSGNGIFGLGWMLSMSSISRRTDKGLPQYLDRAGPDSDTFVISGSEDLVPELVATPTHGYDLPPARKRVTASNTPSTAIDRASREHDGAFTRIELWCNVQAPTTDMHWRSTSADNVLSIYGLDSNSRIVDPTNPLQIFQWLLCQQHDRGNALARKENSVVSDALTSMIPKNTIFPALTCKR
ncbi:hypothetical protein LTS15_010983 [Exophiala xenobiotica]|nr:hypothetical protein LTS15_010983 [Exophiala xenobiotica]